MKKVSCLFPLLILLGFAIASQAQFKLNGKIINYKGQNDLKINIPLISGFYAQNTTAIPLAKDGTFSISLPIAQRKFANLIFQRKFFPLLLDANQHLSLTLNVTDTTMKLMAGSSIPINQLLQQIDIEEFPWFMNNQTANSFGKLSLNEIKEKVILPYFDKRNKKIKMVTDAEISPEEKSYLRLELQAVANNYLCDFARTQITDRTKIDSVIFELFDKVDPKPATPHAGPQYFWFIGNYVRYLESKALAEMKSKQLPSSAPLPYIGVSLDSAKQMLGWISKAQWRDHIAYKNLPLNVAEPYSYQQLVTAFNEKDINLVEELATVYKKKFPNSKYLPDIDKKVNSLRYLLSANANHSQIQLIANYEKINSIYDVVKSYKGKVVYLDIWGTWCGPCKVELRYTPALKEKFKNKDIVFLYLDMDEDTKDKDWKDFIRVNEITGFHLRKSRATIAPIWKELLADAEDKAEYYPQYFIFDRSGKLVVTKARRPSEGDALYTQLNDVLAK